VADVQIEKGYIKISTELFKQIYYKLINPTHLRIILFVIRFTYGYKRKEFTTNLNSIGTTLNLTPDYCKEMILELERRHILLLEWTTAHTLEIQLIKDYDKWKLE